MVEAEVSDELIYRIPLRKAKHSSRARRGDTAVSIVRSFVSRNSKVNLDDVWIDPKVNELVWRRGRRNIPQSINVKVVKLQDGTAEVIML